MPTLTMQDVADLYNSSTSEGQFEQVVAERRGEPMRRSTLAALVVKARKAGLLTKDFRPVEPEWEQKEKQVGATTHKSPDRERDWQRITDDERRAAYWSGVFDTLGDLKVSANGDITVRAQIAHRNGKLIDAFLGRYGGQMHNGHGTYTVILTHDDDGLHALVCDMANNSYIYGDIASKLCRLLEFRYYYREEEKVLISALRGKEEG